MSVSGDIGHLMSANNGVAQETSMVLTNRFDNSDSELSLAEVTITLPNSGGCHTTLI